MYHVFTRENEKTETNPFTYAQKPVPWRLTTKTNVSYSYLRSENETFLLFLQIQFDFSPIKNVFLLWDQKNKSYFQPIEEWDFYTSTEVLHIKRDIFSIKNLFQ